MRTTCIATLIVAGMIVLLLIMPVALAKTKDKTPPVTTATISGTPGNNGWFKSQVTVTLAADDLESDVKLTQYKYVDENGRGTSGWVTYTGPFTLEDGVYTISYKSIDSANNKENAKTQKISIDTKCPTITIYSPVGGTLYEKGSILYADWVAVDSGSGIASSWSVPYDNHGICDTGDGIHEFRVFAADNAGNINWEIIWYYVNWPPATP